MAYVLGWVADHAAHGMPLSGRGAFEMSKRPAWYGGNKIPDSYLKKFQKSVEDEGIPYDLRVFLNRLGESK